MVTGCQGLVLIVARRSLCRSLISLIGRQIDVIMSDLERASLAPSKYQL